MICVCVCVCVCVSAYKSRAQRKDKEEKHKEEKVNAHWGLIKEKRYGGSGRCGLRQAKAEAERRVWQERAFLSLHTVELVVVGLGCMGVCKRAERRRRRTGCRKCSSARSSLSPKP